MMSQLSQSAAGASDDLRMLMRGTVVLPESDSFKKSNGSAVLARDSAFERARKIWNDAVASQPALIALCETPEDVQAAIRVARKHKLPLSVRGGGHDWVGRALRNDGLVIDLTKMRGVEVDRQSRTAAVSGGARSIDVIEAAAPYSLVAVTGNNSGVGMAGLTLGGGYSLLSPRYGLAADNLLSADVVLADGRHLTADEENNAELFWALRGGGGNFGVVVSMRIRLHEVRELFTGSILYPISEAETVLRRYAQLAATAPDELGVLAAIASGPDGSPIVSFATLWTCESATMQVLDDIQHLGTPLLAEIAPTSYAAMLGHFDAQAISGRHYYLRTCWLSDLTSEAVSAIVAAGNTKTSPYSAIALQHFRGAPTRVRPDATAFGQRQPHFMVELIAAWEPHAEDGGVAERQWVEDAWRALEPFALPGGYANLLAPDQHQQIAQAYGANAGRLRKIKQRFDPDGVFSSALPLP